MPGHKPFDDYLFYRDQDLIGDGKIAGTRKTLQELEDHHGLPPAKWVGGVKRRLGADLNAWWLTRPAERRSDLVKRFGEKRLRGRPRKQPTAEPITERPRRRARSSEQTTAP
jgi:hypothetical protein